MPRPRNLPVSPIDDLDDDPPDDDDDLDDDE